jgi:hypothetical protein
MAMTNGFHPLGLNSFPFVTKPASTCSLDARLARETLTLLKLLKGLGTPEDNSNE